MKRVRFEGFSEKLFQFLSGLSENNNKPWFDVNRIQGCRSPGCGGAQVVTQKTRSEEFVVSNVSDLLRY